MRQKLSSRAALGPRKVFFYQREQFIDLGVRQIGEAGER